MADVLIQLTATEHLANDPRLYPDIGNILYRNVPAVKLGALFLDLPYFQGWWYRRLKRALGFQPSLSTWAQVLHTYRPTQLGISLAELAQSDSEYAGKVWPICFTLGYFSHLAVDRVLNSLVHRMVHEKADGDIRQGIQICQHIQSEFFHKEYYGSPILGTSLVKQTATVYGIYGANMQEEVIDFIRKACFKTLAKSPDTKEIRAWVKGFHRYIQWLSFPALQLANIRDDAKSQSLMHTYYRNDFFDFVAYYNHALDMASEYVQTIYEYMGIGDFSEDAQEDLKEIIPEMDILNPPDDEFIGNLADSSAPKDLGNTLGENILPFQPPTKK